MVKRTAAATQHALSVCVSVCVSPSMGRGTKCEHGLVFFTRFPFITTPSLLRPKNQARPDSCWRYSVDE